MIDALKSDEIVNKVGGRFKLTALIQKRMMELMDGARPLVERGSMTDLEIVIQEILGQDHDRLPGQRAGDARGRLTRRWRMEDGLRRAQPHRAGRWRKLTASTERPRDHR